MAGGRRRRRRRSTRSEERREFFRLNSGLRKPLGPIGNSWDAANFSPLNKIAYLRLVGPRPRHLTADYKMHNWSRYVPMRGWRY